MKINEIVNKNKYLPSNIEKVDHSRNVKENATYIANFIKLNCSQMLAVYKEANYCLIRGVKDAAPDINAFTAKIRPNRNPVFMGKKNQDSLDHLFNLMKIPVTRSNSIFCTTSASLAYAWGNPFIVFVNDGWQGLVFNNIKTSYAYYTLYDAAKIVNAPDDMINAENEASAIELINSMEPRLLDSRSLSQVIKERYGDILIKGDSYVGLRINPKVNDLKADAPIITTLVMKELGLWK